MNRLTLDSEVSQSFQGDRGNTSDIQCGNYGCSRSWDHSGNPQEGNQFSLGRLCRKTDTQTKAGLGEALSATAKSLNLPYTWQGAMKQETNIITWQF